MLEILSPEFLSRVHDILPTTLAIGMCASNSTDGSADDSGGDGGPGDSGTTPFLCTWNGNRFVFENDFLFDKPTSRAQTYADAIAMYQGASLPGDKYLIQNPITPLRDKYVFQIKEIEPTVSHIDQFSMSYFEKKHDRAYFVTSDHKDLYEIPRAELTEAAPEQKILYDKVEDVSGNMSDRFQTLSSKTSPGSNESFIDMSTGQILEIEANDIKDDNHVFLLLESSFRDWTLGTIMGQRVAALDGQTTLTTVTSRIFQTVSLAILFIIGYLGFSTDSKDDLNSNNESSESILSKAFDMNVARAEFSSDSGGKSLKISCLIEDEYHTIDVIEPRFYKNATQLVKVPKEAIRAGSASLRITATKHHHVSCAQIISLPKVQQVTTKPLTLTKALHRRENKDYATVLTEKNNDCLITHPSDVIDLEFDLPQAHSSHELGFVLDAHGYYYSAPESVQEELGDWVARLDPEAQSFLKEMYSISQKHQMEQQVGV